MSIKIVAELSGNHNGKIDNMIKLIDAAKEAGADAVKLQTYTADTITVKGDRPELTLTSGPWKGRTLHDLYREAETPWSWHRDLFHHAEQKGLQVFSTPFDKDAVDFLETIRAPFPIFKVSSFDIANLPLLRRINQSYREVYLSTGMATDDEIETALHVLNECDVTLLHCISEYPAMPHEMALGRLDELAEFNMPIGLSDHSLGHAAPVMAVAKGATVIEKHLKLNGQDTGPDAHFSMTPLEFKDMVDWVRLAELACKNRKPKRTHLHLRPSLWVVKDVKKGEIADWQNVSVRRPLGGMEPAEIFEVVGGRFTRDITAPEPVVEGMIQ